jgi:hypothetical protein
MSTPPLLHELWLQEAESCGSTQWLKQFIRVYVSDLQAGRLSPDDFAQALDQALASRHLNTPAQQKNYRSNVVQAIKVFDPTHPAIDLVSLSTEQYRILNDQQRQRLADRQTRFITSQTADVLVERARQLLHSAEWSDVGAGLAVLIGRRISEIVLSPFSLKSPWSLNFSQMAKKQDAQDITIEIPTLAPAPEVLAAIDRLQTGLSVDALRGQGRSERQAKQAVNRLYSGAIAAKCQEHFSDLVPARTDRDNLYTHLFRAVYATIAAHWYCPPSVPEHQFKAEIQGHFTLTQTGRKLSNYAARSNYDDYAIGDGQGNRDGRLGIKLGRVPELAILEAFRQPQYHREESPGGREITDIDLSQELTSERPETPSTELSAQESPTMTQPDTTKSSLKRPSVYADDLERITDLMAAQGVTGSTAEVLHALVEEFEAKIQRQKRQEAQTAGEFAHAINWFTQEIETLRQQCRVLEAQQQQLASPSADSDEVAALKAHNAQLEARNGELEAELEETRSQLNAIQELLGGARRGGRSQEQTQPSPSQSSSSQAPPVSQDASTHASTPSDTAVASSPVTATPPKTSSRASERTDSTDKAADIIDALIRWNTAQERSEQRLRISFPSIRSLAVLVGASYLPAIREAMSEKEAEINDIHERYLIGSRHNRSVLNKDAVLQAIARDYLGLPNWQEATYVN